MSCVSFSIAGFHSGSMRDAPGNPGRPPGVIRRCAMPCRTLFRRPGTAPDRRIPFSPPNPLLAPRLICHMDRTDPVAPDAVGARHPAPQRGAWRHRRVERSGTLGPATPMTPRPNGADGLISSPSSHTAPDTPAPSWRGVLGAHGSPGFHPGLSPVAPLEQGASPEPGPAR